MDSPAIADIVANALGQPESVSALQTLSRHPDPDVRRLVASSLPTCCEPDYVGTDDVVETLLTLMTDQESIVRDWATFALGTQLSADSAQIRAALLTRSGDADHETRHEAVVGLAKRRDPRAYDLVAAALDADEIYALTIEAARFVAHPRLHPRLAQLQDRWDPDALGIDAAVLACDAEAQQRQAIQLQLLLDELEHRLADVGSSLVPTLSCRRGDTGVDLRLEPPAGRDDGYAWEVERLLVRVGGDIARAAERVLDDAVPGWRT